MIEAARNATPDTRWILDDIAHWAGKTADEPDLVFSNAALQWVQDHAALFPQLLNRSRKALAVQMPANLDAPAHQLMRELAESPHWRSSLSNVQQWFSHEPGFYYDRLAPRTSKLDIWQTTYIHVMPTPEAIVEWYKGTGLRPYLDAIPLERDQRRFLDEYTSEIRKAYRPQNTGGVLFPFKRLFLIAYR